MKYSLKRKSQEGDESEKFVEPKKIFTRSKTIPLIDTLCIICQEDSNKERLHAIHSGARDTQLKKAFDIAPKPLAMVKVRFEKVRDAHAGDILYHTSCWEKHVTRSTSDFKIEVTVDRKQINQKVVLSDIAVTLKKGIAGLAQGSIISLKDTVDLYEGSQEEMGESDIHEEKKWSNKTCRTVLKTSYLRILFVKMNPKGY